MPEPRRLLVVIDGMEVAGSQRQIQHLLAGLDRRHWAPELAFFRTPSFLSEAIRHSGIPVHLVPKRRRVDPAFVYALARLLRRGDYALIHAFSLTAELWTVLARDLAGRHPPLVASERSSLRADKARWHWPLKRFVLGRSAAVIANSRAGARSTAQRTGMPEALFTVIPNGVEMPAALAEAERAALRRELGVPEGRVLGLYVGRLAAVKNLPCLVRALAALAPGQRPWIALAGDGPLRAETLALAEASGVAADLCLLGERTDATRLMQAADFLVLPSHFEGLSNALLEAMAAGCPVVASQVGGTPELVEEGRTGLLFPSDDSQALAAAIARLVADPALRARLAQAARRHVERHHSRPALAAATAAVYERCLGTHDRPVPHALAPRGQPE